MILLFTSLSRETKQVGFTSLTNDVKHARVWTKWLLLPFIYNTKIKMPLESDDGEIKTFHIRGDTQSNHCLSLITELSFKHFPVKLFIVTFFLNVINSESVNKSQTPVCCCRVLCPSAPGCPNSPFSLLIGSKTVMWGELPVTHFSDLLIESSFY